MKAGVRSRGSPMLKSITLTPAGTRSRRLRSRVTKGYSPEPVKRGFNGPRFAAGRGSAAPAVIQAPRVRWGLVCSRPRRAWITPPRSRALATQKSRQPLVGDLEIFDRAVFIHLMGLFRDAGSKVEGRDSGGGEARHVGPALLARHPSAEAVHELSHFRP